MDWSSQTVNLQRRVEFVKAAMIDLLPLCMKKMLRKEVVEIHES